MLDLALGCEPNKYKPLINYRGNTLAVGSDGIRYLADSGKSKSHAELFYGVGKKFATNQGSSTNINYHDNFNTLSANIDVPLNAYREFIVGSGYSSTSMVGGLCIAVDNNSKLVAGIEFNAIDYTVEIHDMTVSSFQGVVTATLDMTTGVIRVYVNGQFHAELIDETIIGQSVATSYKFQTGSAGALGLLERDFYNGIINNVILSQFIWTPTQIQFQYNFPELFLCPDKQLQADGSYKWFPTSQHLNQDDLDSFVVHLAMSEKDDKVRNYIGYSEGAINAEALSFGGGTTGDGNVATMSANRLDFNIIADTLNANQPQLMVFLPNYTDLFLVTVKITITSGISFIKSIVIDGADYTIGETVSAGTYTYSIIGKPQDWGGVPRFLLLFDGTQEFTFEGNATIETKKLTNTHEIPNFTDSVNLEAINMNTGYQSCFYEQDERGVICGSNFNFISMNGVAKPALAIPMTDTELNGTEGKWVIEFAIRRVSELLNTVLLESYISSKGLFIYTSRSYNADLISVVLYDGSATVNVVATLSDNTAGFIQIENDGNNIAILLDGDLLYTRSHNFIPSGRSFSESAKICPIGKLAEFKVWYGDNYYKYDRAKSLAKGLIAKDLLT